MDGASMNRYEKQLYTVFKTFDVDNEEALDKSAVHELCDALQLEDRGAALVNTLFEQRAGRVTFAQFRNGLLAVLGGDASADQPAQQSDDDSSGREVAPKFVFGSKKYGRRSRPPRSSFASDEPTGPRSSSVSRLDSDDRRARQRTRCRRSASAMESREEIACGDPSERESAAGAVEHDRRIDRDEALALCRGLSMDRIDRRLVERIFEDSGSSDTTVGEFFDRLNSSLTTGMEEAAREADARVSPRGDDDEAGAGVAVELVLEAWERAGVRRPRRLLAELGFATPVLRPPELERALDDELRALAEPPDDRGDARGILNAAALALCRLRLERARRLAEAAAAERDKLRADVAEANRRAGLLAQEVDESHARLEGELRAGLRRAEARHAEAARAAAAELSAERERAAGERARLDAELARRCESESRSRAEAVAARARADELETRAARADERLAEAEAERARLAGELREARERFAEEAARGGASSAQAAELARLRSENRRLRDRNDELCAELEARARAPPSSADAPRGGDLSAELDSPPTRDDSEHDGSAVVGAHRVLEILDAIPSIEAECERCARVAAAVGDARGAVREPERDPSEAGARVEAAVSTIADLGAEAVRERVAELERRHDEEKRKLTGLVRELEIDLERMRSEYDGCEEYWSGKLEEEREAHGEEQRLGDERLAELAAKIGEYERQFAAGAALPTIDERHSLEAQFTDLEEEFARYRAAADGELAERERELAERERELAERERELARLAERVRALEEAARRRPRDYHNPAFGAGPPCERGPAGAAAAGELRELRARTARAEAAVRRLHARLAAADLLVKDLYVENCQLAHRRPL